MQFYSDRVTDQYGNVKASASVSVLLNGLPATIYSDDGVTTQANPITTASDGSFSFYAANGTYTLSVSDAESQTVTLLDYTEAATATPQSSSTVLGETGGVVKRFRQDQLGPAVSVFRFLTAAQIADVRAGALGEDVTTALQTAEDETTAAGQLLTFPSGNYLVTDTIARDDGSMWVGDHRNQGNTSGFVNGTKITFSPTSAKSLWVPTAPTALYRVGYVTDGFHVKGNSASAAGNSIYAFDVEGLNKCRFGNLTIDGFRYGFRCYATINNRFEFIKIVNTYIASVLYDGGVSTTDVWDQCYFGLSPIGIETSGENLGIRFHHPIFEGLTTYGMNLVRESAGFMVLNGYGEDTPSANVATNAMFRVGFDGSTTADHPQLIVHGGYYGGRNAGAVGSLFDIDNTSGVILGGFHATRWTNGIKTSSNTLTDQVVSTGWTGTSISSMVTDDTKVSGFFPRGVTNSSSRNDQTHRLTGDLYTGTPTACTGAITTSVNWALERNGNTVTLKLPATVGTASAAASFAFGEAVPAKYRPSASQVWAVPIKDNGANLATPGLVELDYLTGVLTVYKDGTRTANFTAAAVAGLAVGTSISWVV